MGCLWKEKKRIYKHVLCVADGFKAIQVTHTHKWLYNFKSFFRIPTPSSIVLGAQLQLVGQPTLTWLFCWGLKSLTESEVAWYSCHGSFTFLYFSRRLWQYFPLLLWLEKPDELVSQPARITHREAFTKSSQVKSRPVAESFGDLIQH